MDPQVPLDLCQQSQQIPLLIFAWTLLGVAILITALRLYSKSKSFSGITADDYLALASTVRLALTQHVVMHRILRLLTLTLLLDSCNHRCLLPDGLDPRRSRPTCPMHQRTPIHAPLVPPRPNSQHHRHLSHQSQCLHRRSTCPGLRTTPSSLLHMDSHHLPHR